jgi:hypothetical protein
MRDRSFKRDKKRKIAMAHASCVAEGTLAMPQEYSSPLPAVVMVNSFLE